MRRNRFSALLLLPALLLAGWVGYRSGPSLPNEYRSIAVKTFQNETGEPQLEFAATQQALREFQGDGSLAITESADADLILETTLRDCDFDAVRFARKRTATGQEYRMTVRALITLTDRRTGAVLFQQRAVTGEATFETAGDIQQARLSAHPRVSRDLAQKIVKQVVEYW